ncbi:GNAT family N-acetyltransferase [Paenibacillus baekrokdamisoli]|uniref:GNAT family N-acetyltransferase n=1 Tax=Paenibacillus baekrokdamisoli TaxID=1712516 RepID=UPI00406409B6
MRRLEEYALNGWPAFKTMLDDGWLLRFADGYTKRSNSISPLYNQYEEDMINKIMRCEACYANAGLDTVFKMTPFAPNGLDQLLEERGYTIVDPSSVKVLDNLNDITLPDVTEIEVEETLTSKWLDTLAVMHKLSDKNKAITNQLLSDSYLKHGYFILYHQSEPVACGLGVLEDHYVGLYDIITAEVQRNQGFGEQLILHILNWAKMNGATKSYLLVVQNNLPANKLYDKLNYQESYSYWYRVKKLEVTK